MTVADAPGANEAGTPLSEVVGTSLQVMLFNVSLPVLVTTAEKLIGCPGAEAFVHVLATVIAGAVRIVQVALALAVTVPPPQMAGTVPVQVTVSVEGLVVGT